jgi:hypothetical protein
MNEAPEVPLPPPEIPKGKLWAALSVPPVVTVIGTFVAGSSLSTGGYGIEFLFVLPVALLAIVACLCHFVSAWKVRYRGRSLVLASIGYFLGRILVLG